MTSWLRSAISGVEAQELDDPSSNIERLPVSFDRDLQSFDQLQSEFVANGEAQAALAARQKEIRERMMKIRDRLNAHLEPRGMQAKFITEADLCRTTP